MHNFFLLDNLIRLYLAEVLEHVKSRCSRCWSSPMQSSDLVFGGEFFRLTVSWRYRRLNHTDKKPVFLSRPRSRWWATVFLVWCGLDVPCQGLLRSTTSGKCQNHQLSNTILVIVVILLFVSKWPGISVMRTAMYITVIRGVISTMKCYQYNLFEIII